MAALTTVVNVLRQGNIAKSDPFTIIIISNPSLETPWNTGTFVIDPITTNQSTFDLSAQYVNTVLFGGLPNQRELFLGDPTIAPQVRVVSLFISGLPAIDANSLVGEDPYSDTLVPRRSNFAPLLNQFGYKADIAYAISQSGTHMRASAYFTSDDDSRAGIHFTMDGAMGFHRFYNLIPGTIALHITSDSVTALHEFGHALSSYTNGSILDLYVDSGAAVNNKRGRPIPGTFCVYNGLTMSADITRNSIGYPAGWQSYQCELVDPSFPAIMDNYWLAHDGIPEHCQHDRITRQFLIDRVRAKIAR